MGSCQSAADGSSPLSVNQAGVEDIKRNITNKFQDHKNESTKKIYSAQKILIQQDPGFNEASPMYATETYKRFGPIILEGPCANYGCAYDVDQSSNVEIYSFNETIVNESEDIWTDIKSKLQQDASTQFAGNQSKLDAFNSGVNSAEEEAIKNIKSILTNISQTDLGKDQTVTIKYSTPIKCKDPCGGSLPPGSGGGPTLKQDAHIIVKSEDILNSTMEIVQKRLAQHDVDVTQEVDSSNEQCIAELLSCTCCCIICMVLCYMVYAKFMDKGGEAVGEAVAMKMAKR